MREYSHAYVIWTRRHIQVNVNVEKYVRVLSKSKQVYLAILTCICLVYKPNIQVNFIVCYPDESRARFIHPDRWGKLLWAKMPLSLILVLSNYFYFLSLILILAISFICSMLQDLIGVILIEPLYISFL